MYESIENQLIPERLVCPNCPADYPAPFSRRHITCRRCETSFLAPDEARDGTDDVEPTSERCDEPGVKPGPPTDGVDDADDRFHRALRQIRTSAPAVALAFNVVAFCFWLAGAASFEIAAMTMLLVMNGVAVQDRR